jgi:hypothetical protein
MDMGGLKKQTLFLQESGAVNQNHASASTSSSSPAEIDPPSRHSGAGLSIREMMSAGILEHPRTIRQYRTLPLPLTAHPHSHPHRSPSPPTLTLTAHRSPSLLTLILIPNPNPHP